MTSSIGLKNQKDRNRGIPDTLLDMVSLTNIRKEIEHFANYSTTSVGVSRIAYSKLERDSHEYFSEYMTRLGLSVWRDSAGNTIAEYRTKNADGTPCLATGSHLDSVPKGGRFDGIVGVVAAMEIARVLSESQTQLSKPWRFIAFCAEEGARFGQACNGSRAIAGLTEAHHLDALVDETGISMSEAMRAIGLDPEQIAESKWNPDDCAGFLELHIEQGREIEAESLDLGIVNVISGSERFLVTVLGEPAHSGGTPMHLRRDSLLTAAKIIVSLDEYSRKPENEGVRITVGRLKTLPGSITTVPGWVEFSVDVRDFDSNRRSRISEEVTEIICDPGEENGTKVTFEQIGNTHAMALDQEIIDLIQAVANEHSIRTKVLPSGASHDCQIMEHVTSTGLIFVPSVGGHSHMPSEFSSFESIHAGVRLLFASLFRMDGISLSLRI